MARRQPAIRPPGTRNISVFRDPDGNLLVEFEHFSETSELDLDGNLVQVRRSQAREMADGNVLTAQMAMSRRPIPLCVCAACRRPPFRAFGREAPSPGLILARNARTCHRCGRFFCVRHAQQCSDGKWRCVSCVRWFRFTRFFRWLFFTSKRG